ncbi:hypothetical protein AtDm6_0755 [Acetobacter tropicalis]|uniref:Uncharacterized protein n=1 Tax=Acetobacter tropicalis TaxID=104102 RepID=A0A094YU64_9PROT|nr:hypothetical protein AtDm6_0755 [Acetobacter tropicalis]
MVWESAHALSPDLLPYHDLFVETGKKKPGSEGPAFLSAFG